MPTKKELIEINQWQILGPKKRRKINHWSYLINQRIKTLEKANIRDWNKV